MVNRGCRILARTTGDHLALHTPPRRAEFSLKLRLARSFVPLAADIRAVQHVLTPAIDLHQQAADTGNNTQQQQSLNHHKAPGILVGHSDTW
jgi:hypothetical protein